MEFCNLIACQGMPYQVNQNNIANLQKTLMFIYMQKINLMPIREINKI